MKLLITLLALISINFSVFAGDFNPDVLISNEDIEVIAIAGLEFFQSSYYNNESENLNFFTSKNISVVKIFNLNGELEFQLPVMSNNVQINKNLFASGRYKLGFLLEGQSNIHYAHVTVK